ncbi:hypothetical protein [Klebsiella pneumoniae]
MLPVPDLLTPLNGIISPSESNRHHHRASELPSGLYPHAV